MSRDFLSLPVRRSLEGVSWASLSVRWVPTQEQKRRRREEAEQPRLPGEHPERRPPLRPVGGRRFPFERLYFRLGRGDRGMPPPYPTASRRKSGAAL